MRAVLKVRVDAGNRIGLGHLIRCFSVASIAKKEMYDSIFYLVKPPEEVLTLINDHGYETKQLSKDSSFLKMLGNNDIVVLDGYHFNESYERSIKEKVKRLITIDDLQNRKFYSDVVINHTPGIRPQNYRKEPYTKIYSGLSYSLLRQEILHAEKKMKATEPLRNCFICLGGEDSKNITLQTIEYIIPIFPDLRIDIVVGPLYKHLSSLQSHVKRGKIKIHSKVSANKMVSLIKSNDFAIVSASTISLECAYLGIPLYLVLTEENQRTNYDFFLRYKLGSQVEDIINYNLETGKVMIQNQDKSFVGNIESNIKRALFL
ncbi:MAG: UDP-2,4-diacetamido-2,4,6-trideoxy-beta-L-altropyranose hydrolase [Cyclobacteriaceae bacterium]